MKHLFELITQLKQEDFENLVDFIEIQQAERARRIMGQNPFPSKSYLDDKWRAGLLRENGINAVCLGEAQAALEVDDTKLYLQWLACAKLTAKSLRMLKQIYGAKLIKEMGFDTSAAEIAYGKDWLEKENVLS